ncbi:hypothetical protein M438DRAFT_340409 [Aureobasidium pullulans EXF-150]|uniref:BZIP domain-containing protein n=1 Tax=Aureobasidium pullulans EXF-150 TaxID=1043002 RepID=A0A074X015_AURPU|nr:uncharacterized protein M438DRAFT_340409 [Aureobasidium pullulans EXF-150]KEQ78748.1 hypothetical protein M438DRAFT_340409 [Aureobasidium pullulans EXF-150]
MSSCALNDSDPYTGDAGYSDQMDSRCRTNVALVEDAATRKKLQNRIAQKAYRKRLKSRMEELESFRDTMTVAKMTLLTGASPGTDQDDPNRQAISNQLSMPTVRVPILGGPDESTESVSYFDSRDNAIPISRIGLQTPPANVEISYNPDQDMPSLGSWDLDEAYPVVLSLNGIGLANREHASPRFCARPLEEPGYI